MKKIFAIALAAMLSLGLFVGCGDTESSGSGNNNNNNTKNTKPTISGVQASATVMAGEEFDALAGVTATDKEDGDLTGKITVSANGLTFTDGKTSRSKPLGMPTRTSLSSSRFAPPRSARRLPPPRRASVC